MTLGLKLWVEGTCLLPLSLISACVLLSGTHQASLIVICRKEDYLIWEPSLTLTVWCMISEEWKSTNIYIVEDNDSKLPESKLVSGTQTSQVRDLHYHIQHPKNVISILFYSLLPIWEGWGSIDDQSGMVHGHNSVSERRTLTKIKERGNTHFDSTHISMASQCEVPHLQIFCYVILLSWALAIIRVSLGM